MTPASKVKNLPLKFYPATPQRWKDVVQLFGEKGACAGCWCLWWKLPRSRFDEQRGEGNKKALKKIIDSGEIPGILAYHKGEPVGWCALEPRENYPVLERSRVLKRVDELPVWSVTCFFVAKPYRGKGISSQLLAGGLEYAKKKGAKIVEGYPTETGKKLPDPWVWTGLVAAFAKARFVEVLRRSKSRPIMRYYCNGG